MCGQVQPSFHDQRIARLYAYWTERRGPRRMPSRADIDPIDLRFVLGDIVLAEVHRDPLRFRYRVHGINLVASDGFEMTGKWLHDMPEPDYRQRVLTTWTEVVASGRPHHVIRQIVVDRRPRRYESLVLPLTLDGEAVGMLIGAQINLPLPEAAAG